jgi:hypothetical protein
MINDVLPPDRPLQRPKPKRIEPITKPTEGPSLHEQAKAIEPDFKTPEEIAAEAADAPADTPTVVHHKDKTGKPRRLSWPLSRKQQIILAGVAIVLAGGIGAGWTLTHHKRAVVAEVVKPAAKKAPVAAPVIYSTLSGLPVADASVNQKPVTGVMIENSLDARPQSGLASAGVVFEAVAEGGVTRFLALYQDTAPDNVGPIRSARPYYVSWAMGFDAAYAHVGGSPDALSDITAWGVKDMNQFYNGSSYHRVSSRPSPHNVYTAISTLNQLETTKHFTSTYTGFPRGKAAVAATPTASSIDLHLSGPAYDPHYTYNTATNSYDRSEAGSPQLDANTGKQLSPQVVIAIVVPLARGALDASGAYYSNYTTTGSGAAYIFQNGSLTQGTWAKTGNKDQMTFSDASGQSIKLNPGQTWISAVSSSNQVVYK